MKKLISFVLLFCFIITYTSISHAADYTLIHENSSETVISKGVTFRSVRQFTTKGWMNINIVKTDLSEKNISIEPLFDKKGIGSTNNILNISKDKNVVAAVNADYFSTITSPTRISWPVGTVIENGKIVSAQSYAEDKFATLGITKDRLPIYSYWSSNVNVYAANGNSSAINLVNKYYSDFNKNSIIMYDKDWGSNSVGSTGLYGGITEVVVENSVIKEIRKNMPGTPIPQNGFILAAISELNPFLDSNFQIGDTVKISSITNPDLNYIDTAISGGTLLLKDGEYHPITWKHYGKNPVTAVGTDKSNRYMYMVTIDGRQAISGGMTQKELAEFMKSLGCYNAIQMDGGGSTSLVTRLPGDQSLKVSNSPSDGNLRNISTGLGIVNNAPKSELKTLIVEPVNQNVFVNTSLGFNVKGYDINYNPIAIDASKVRWKVSGLEGKFKNNIFYPSTVGYGTITATYDGVSANCNIYSLSAPVELVITPSTFYGTENQSFNIKVEGKNKNGYLAPISTDDIAWSAENNTADIRDGKIRILNTKGGTIKASMGDVHAYGYVASSDKNVVDKFESINGGFIGYPAEVTGSYELSSSIVKNGTSSGKLNFDFTKDIEASKAAYLKLNTPISLDENVSKIGVWVYSQPTYSHWLRAQLTDANGNIFRTNLASSMDWEGWKYVETDIPTNAAFPLQLERLYIAQTDPAFRDMGTVYFDDITLTLKNNQINSKDIPSNTKYKDPLNTAPDIQETSKPLRLMVFGDTIKPTTLLENLLMKKMINTANANADKAIFLGFNNPTTISGLEVESMLTNGFYSKTIANNLFISLDSSKRTLREPDETQWLKLKQYISSVKSDNVFILMPSALDGKDGFIDPMEADLLKEMLTQEIVQRQNKNVFFLYNGNKNDGTIYRGVRYLSTKGIQEIDIKNLPQNIEELQYILFTIDGKNVTYEIKTLFK